MSDKQKNVLGEDLEECSNDPLTGWYRDGCCSTDENDHGVHTVCAKVTTEFLEWCKEAGNDLITPHPIGVSCRTCDRLDCPQRAFPPLHKKFDVDINSRGVSVYVNDKSS